MKHILASNGKTCKCAGSLGRTDKPSAAAAPMKKAPAKVPAKGFVPFKKK